MALSMAGAPINKEMVEVEHQLVEAFGFVPQLFRAQSAEPRAIVAQMQLVAAIVLTEGSLSPHQKQSLLFAVASARRNEYCRALHVRSALPDGQQSRMLFNFVSKLACRGPWSSAEDIEALTRAGLDDQAILEAVVTTALGQMLCVLAEALQPSSDRDRPQSEALNIEMPAPPDNWEQSAGPYLKSPPQPTPDFKPFAVLRDQLGFIPKVFRAQMPLPDLVAAEVDFLDQIVQSEESLSRVQKELVLLAVSASNLNTYGVALQRQILDGLGVAFEQSDAIVDDLRSASIPPADKALLEEVSKLNSTRPRAEACFRAALEDHGFTKPQIVEAIAVAAFANFLNTLQFGLGVKPDFPPARIFTPKDLYLPTTEARPTSDEIRTPDPDAEFVKQVQDGNVDAFEELVRRHSGRVFGTVAGIVGNLDDARDATQDVFLKAFENIARFEGRAKFSTWLISIAINTGTEMLRHRKHTESLGAVDDEEDFHPRQVQQWAEDPEQIVSAAQRNELVRDKILQLPEKYRVALILRDINQLSIEEAAVALEIGVPALKARVLRGRLMLRERLAPHFARDRERDDA